MTLRGFEADIQIGEVYLITYRNLYTENPKSDMALVYDIVPSRRKNDDIIKFIGPDGEGKCSRLVFSLWLTAAMFSVGYSIQ